MKKTIRIAAGQGFWGDLLSAPAAQVRRGPIDYLMLDYLAEVTMSILQKQRSRDASQGYARDFVPLMRDILPDMRSQGYPRRCQRRRREHRSLPRRCADRGAQLETPGQSARWCRDW